LVHDIRTLSPNASKPCFPKRCLSARYNGFLDIGGLKLLNGEFVVAVRELKANPDEKVNVGWIAHLAELRVEIYFVFWQLF